MGRSVTFEVPGKPQPKQRARRGKSGRWYTPSATRQYEKHVGVAGLCALDGPRFEGRLKLTVVAYMPDQRRRDADNVAKSVSDGLNGVVWDDDDQVVELVVRKELDRDHPRTKITIEELDT